MNHVTGACIVLVTVIQLLSSHSKLNVIGKISRFFPLQKPQHTWAATYICSRCFSAKFIAFYIRLYALVRILFPPFFVSLTRTSKTHGNSFHFRLNCTDLWNCICNICSSSVPVRTIYIKRFLDRTKMCNA